VSALAQVARKAHALGLAQLAREAEAVAFAAGQVPVTEGVFAREGAMWTLSYGGVTARMRDAKGLSDLAVLLAVPGRQVPAADLIAAAGAGQAGLADLRMGADEVLDATARRQVRARLASLGEDIAEAESWNDPEPAARARAERDALLRELAAVAAPGRAVPPARRPVRTRTQGGHRPDPRRHRPTRARASGAGRPPAGERDNGHPLLLLPAHPGYLAPLAGVWHFLAEISRLPRERTNEEAVRPGRRRDRRAVSPATRASRRCAARAARCSTGCW
jgi:hypothetical protein